MLVQSAWFSGDRRRDLSCQIVSIQCSPDSVRAFTREGFFPAPREHAAPICDRLVPESGQLPEPFGGYRGVLVDDLEQIIGPLTESDYASAVGGAQRDRCAGGRST